MTANQAPAKAGAREWIGLGVLSLGTLAVSFDIFVLLLALPHLSASLKASSTQQLWIIDIYGFMVGGFLVTMGTLGDRIGRRKLLLIGAAVFGSASVLSAYSVNPGMLIAARALLGVGGATLAPSTLALISNMFQDNRHRAQAIGVWAGCFTVGAIIGPVVGGVLLEHFWWGSVFLLGVPAMGLLLLLGPVLVPEYRAPGAGRIDLASVGLSLAAVLPTIYGIKQLAIDGWQPLPFGALLAGLAVGFVFVRRQQALADPLLDLRLFGNRDFRIALISMLFYTMLTGTTLVFITQYFQSVAGLSPLQAALGLLPGLAAGTVSVTVAPMLARRFRPAYLIAAGQVVVIAGLVICVQVGTTSGSVSLVAGFTVWCLGGGPLLALGTNMVVGAAPRERAGSASSMSQISSEFGYALGIATVGTIGTAVYRSVLAPPAGVPARAAAAARESVASAVSVAGHLPGVLGARLLTSARDAFDSGLQTVAGLSAVLLAGIAILVATRLRHLRPFSGPPAAPDAAAVDGAQAAPGEAVGVDAAVATAPEFTAGRAGAGRD